MDPCPGCRLSPLECSSVGFFGYILTSVAMCGTGYDTSGQAFISQSGADKVGMTLYKFTAAVVVDSSGPNVPRYR